MNEDLRKLREAWHDLCYVVLRDLGIPRLAARFGRPDLRPWAEAAKQRVDAKK